MANCRTGMFQACSSPLGRVLVDKQIYLPERWTQAAERGAATRVPKDRGRSRSKSQLALEMLEWALEGAHLRSKLGRRRDAFGISPSFRENLAALRMRYVLDVPANFTVWPMESACTIAAYQARGAPSKPKHLKGGPKTGRKRYHSEAVQGTKALAQRRLTELLRQVDTGAFVGPSRLTFGECLEQWLRDSVKGRVSNRALEGYRGTVARYLFPRIGKIPL